MADHPIQGLMKTAMENIREMVDVNTIIGDAVETPDGHIIIPVSRVGFGFAAGGSEFTGGTYEDGGSDPGRARDHGQDQGQIQGSKFPFGGGSGGGISITPVAFIVVGGEQGIKVVSMEKETHLYDKLIDLVPSLMERVQNTLKNRKKDSPERKDTSGHLNDCI
ncbi:GerW family sporulation protein [Lihuaxuella thermophila]|uniref:Sporulation protein YtfJ n=1 Tax=Lihuaxuella thermophila TaxID=1173111 RepID=A0A1H8F4V8_9BACL|nr:GerW family sporulation protein [Lihuaxuella thermophila]SEN26650.1 sporulation protein YtfJ [Lihuaxuella thermophila]